MNPIDHSAEGALAHSEHHEHLSAFIDGEVEGTAADRCCAHWREQAEARRRWHEWHLIGDVLRSEELACGATHSARFLEQVRSRLADEPVLLAPSRQTNAVAAPVGDAAPQWRRAWRMPAAVAAGFMAVIVALVVSRAPAPQQQTLASAGAPLLTPAAGPTMPAGPNTAPPDEPQFVVADGRLVRDARLDRYLAAHKQFGGSSALGVPSGFLRSATLQIPER